MEEKGFLEAGKIVNTHGTRGEVKIQPWADSAAFLQGFETLYLDSRGEKQAVTVQSAKVHKGCLIAQFAGVTEIGQAIALKNKVVYINRGDVQLPPGHFFIRDILGLPVVDEDGVPVGTLREILPLPGGDVYVVAGEREHLIPNVPAFVLEKNLEAGFIRVRLIEGM